LLRKIPSKGGSLFYILQMKTVKVQRQEVTSKEEDLNQGLLLLCPHSKAE
jgi:hypothetical protein